MDSSADSSLDEPLFVDEAHTTTTTTTSSTSVSSTDASGVVGSAGEELRGNALYARLAKLMGTKGDEAVEEIKALLKQALARKPEKSSQLWDAGEEVEPAGGKSRLDIGRPPPKRTGPPAPVSTGARIQAATVAERKRDKGGRPLASVKSSGGGGGGDKSSASEDSSNDASSCSVDRVKQSASLISSTSTKVCVRCQEGAETGSGENPLLACVRCSLPEHAKCASVEEKDYSNPRFVYVCSSCQSVKRSRSESPKPRGAIAIDVLPVEKKRMKDVAQLEASASSRSKPSLEEYKKKKEERMKQKEETGKK